VAVRRKGCRINSQRKSSPWRAPVKAQRDRRLRPASVNQILQLAGRRNSIRGNATLKRKGDLRRQDAFLVVLNKDTLGILILRDEVAATRHPSDGGGVIPYDGQILAPVQQEPLCQGADMHLSDLFLGGPRHCRCRGRLGRPNAVELIVVSSV